MEKPDRLKMLYEDMFLRISVCRTLKSFLRGRTSAQFYHLALQDLIIYIYIKDI